uniref:nucleoside diphosphate phosphatase n=1 Tax=Oryzias melastigma TaxID=30732 RepID=A0A3B3DYM6_ORYME
MKRPKIAVLLFVAFLLVYLLFLKNHYSTSKAPPFRPPPHAEPGLGRTDDGRLGSADGLNFQYGIMFDAGSTGTRVHIFKLQMKSREPPTVDHETFEAIKPGLSAYADDPEKCAAGIQKLLLVARSSVPPSMWARTPLVLKATAGLRLLPGEKAKQLLDKVRQIFQESPFLSRDDSVSIMEGTDEGISAWITVNVLIGETRSSSLRCLIGFGVERAEPDQEQVYRQCSAAASAGRLKQILTPKTCFGSGSMGFSSWVLYLQIGLTCDRSLDPTVLQLLVVFFSLNVTVEDRMMMVMKNSGLKSG